MRYNKNKINKKDTLKKSNNKNKSSMYKSENLLIIIPISFVIAFTYFNQKQKPTTNATCSKSTIGKGSSLQQQNPNLKGLQACQQSKAAYTSINLQTTEKRSPRTNTKVWGINGSHTKKTPRNLEQKTLIADNSSDMSFQKKKSQYQNDRYYPSCLQIGPNYTRVNLKPDDHNSFNGNLWGAQGSYEYKPTNDLYAGATLAWRQGDIDGPAGSRYLLYIDTQERLGYTFASEKKKWLVTLFSGFGYRHLGHHLKPTTGSSRHFRYNEFYVPVGLISDINFTSRFTWGMGVTWMPQVFPTVSTSPGHGNNWSLKYRLANFFVEMPFDFAVTKNRRFHITFNPFYETWKDGHSTAKTSTGASLGLPSNDYNFWGADLNFGYYF